MPGGNPGEIVGRVGRWGPRPVAKVIRIVFAGMHDVHYINENIP